MPDKFRIISIIIAALTGAALLYIRIISSEFVLGTDTFDHPYIEFFTALIIAGLCWLVLIPTLKRMDRLSMRWMWGLIIFGVCLRAAFIGSTPIYEADWNRYLWDGAVTTQGQNPYEYAPEVTFRVANDAPQIVKDLQRLSAENGAFTNRINYPELTTIYPPVAMTVFTLAAVIDPFNLDVLRSLYLGIDMLALWILILTLRSYGRNAKWALLYWLNPLLIYSVYNAGHMDIILVPFLLLALYLVKHRPFSAAMTLGFAAGVKLWPLLLGPVLLRRYRNSLPVFIGAGLISGLVCLGLLLPMLLSLKENSGLLAYSSEWHKSSFLFSYLRNGLAFLTEDAGRAARLFIALVMTGLSFWFALKPRIDELDLPVAMLLIPLTLYILSPTGYPWYAIWFLPFLCFVPLYGAAVLTVTVALYYVRYAMRERGIYDIYTDYLVPLQFGLPLIILGVEALKHRRSDQYA